MLYPTISELTKDEFNRYELALATAKCARLITDEYVRQREIAEKAAKTAMGNKETEKNLIKLINKEYRDEKAVKNAITHIYAHDYRIVRKDMENGEFEEAEPSVEMTAEVDTASDAD